MPCFPEHRPAVFRRENGRLESDRDQHRAQISRSVQGLGMMTQSNGIGVGSAPQFDRVRRAVSDQAVARLVIPATPDLPRSRPRMHFAGRPKTGQWLCFPPLCFPRQERLALVNHNPEHARCPLQLRPPRSRLRRVITAPPVRMYQLYRLSELGLRVRCSRPAPMSRHWYWNRYPAPLRSESYSYCYSFSKELLQEWGGRLWQAIRNAALWQLRRDKFDLAAISSQEPVAAAIYEDNTRLWCVALGRQAIPHALLITRSSLCHAHLPRIEARAFRRAFHTARGPTNPGFRRPTGRRDRQPAQRCVQPSDDCLKRRRLTVPAHAQLVRARTTAIDAGPSGRSAGTRNVQAFQETFACFSTADPRGAFSVSDGEREAFYEKLYVARGCIFQATFATYDRPPGQCYYQRFVREKSPARQGSKGCGKNCSQTTIRHPPATARTFFTSPKPRQKKKNLTGRHHGNADRRIHQGIKTSARNTFDINHLRDRF